MQHQLTYNIQNDISRLTTFRLYLYNIDALWLNTSIFSINLPILGKLNKGVTKLEKISMMKKS